MFVVWGGTPIKKKERNVLLRSFKFQVTDLASHGQLVQSTFPLVMCYAGPAVQTSSKINRNKCHITGKAPCRTTTLELSFTLPRSHALSLRENSTIKKLVCTRGGERKGAGEVEGPRMLQESLCLLNVCGLIQRFSCYV